MPDLRAIRRHERELRSLEDFMAYEGARAYRAFRVTLTDQLDRGGLALFLITLPLALEQLRRDLRRLADQTAHMLMDEALRFVEDELARLSELLGAPLSVVWPTSTDLRPLLLAQLAQATAWLDLLGASLRVEALSLQAQGAELPLVRDRLLGVSLGGSLASIWRQFLARPRAVATELVWQQANATRHMVYQRVAQGNTGREWGHQAIAAIDERTTRTCLRVHSQIQPLDKPFKLSGTPRYADKMMAPPFHHYCRTSEVLYLPELETVGITTEAMREAALAELQSRKNGSREEIHPAHSTSRRPTARPS